jgi:Dolichyl-phosphate-mannose-protein mannosyltransferase
MGWYGRGRPRHLPSVGVMLRGVTMPPRLSGLAAVGLLTGMFLVMLGSSGKDALTMDEPLHITAGYTYLRFRDARLNPEHPPLLKLLAAVPLLPLTLSFPLTHPTWSSDEAWTIWSPFLYESGNDPHRIAARARLVPIGLTVGLGGLLFHWARRWAGAAAGLLALWCYAWSPTILAHGRLVTTDVAAAFGVVLAGGAFCRFLGRPSAATAVAAGLTLGLALLLKFSLVLLVPWWAVLLLLWRALEPARRRGYGRGALLISGSAALLVVLPYTWMTARYPPERQFRDTYMSFVEYAGGPLGRTGPLTAPEDVAALGADRTRDLRACARHLAAAHWAPLRRCPADLVILTADVPVIRAWGAYLWGLLLTLWRASAGDVTYFLGEVSASGWWSYFPVVYALKEPLPFHLLTGVALLVTVARGGARGRGRQPLAHWLRRHPTETLMLGWIALYWGMALQATLNIGVRHLLPVFPLTIMLVARAVSRWLAALRGRPGWPTGPGLARAVAVAGLVLWQAVSVVRVYPAFLAYFNEAIGGPAQGARYVVDSNLDWGQDLRRLRAFVEAHHIEQIAVDYFGGGSPAYELGPRSIPWWSAKGPYPGWLAVSATILQSAQGRWDPALGWQPEEAYAWLRGRTPVATIGYSIWVFDLRAPEEEPRAPTSSRSH